MDFLQEYGSIITNINDIEQYFNNLVIVYNANSKQNSTKQLLNQWNTYKQEYLLIFQVARDFLPVLGVKVDIERLFNIVREILSLRHSFMSTRTLRALILIKDYICRQAIGQV